MTNWATTSDVYNLTGETVEDVDINKAQGIIDLFSEVTSESALTEDGESTGQISPKNLRYLRQATAYQTVWMLQHPDVFTNVDYSTFSEDGLSATNTHSNAQILAPLATRALRRLTWLRPNRSLRVRPRLDPSRMYDWNTRTDRDSAVADDDRYWTPT